MRKTAFIAAGLAALMAAPFGADAAVRAFWDQSKGEWVKYDLSAPGGRAYSSIEKKIVKYDGPFPPNTIVINTSERRLYYVFAKDKAWKYGIGVGREGFQWAGTDYISAKAEWPGWTPPPEMVARERAKGRILPAYMKGGPNNPLGARALYIGGTMYRIHGSNEPWSIGQAVSSGCIRLVNDDVIDLYSKVKVGTRVVVLTGKESATQLAALAKPPAPKKKAPVVVDARVKDDDATAAAPAIPGSTDMTGSTERPVKDQQASIVRSEDDADATAEPAKEPTAAN